MQHDALIIEDEPILARNMKVFLERAGYSARTACCGELGLALIDASKPDILLLDYQLPGMTGLELLARLRERHTDVKVVMLTGKGSVEVAVEAMRLGAAEFLTKPVSLGKLRSVVDQILGHGCPPPVEGKRADHAKAADGSGSSLLDRIKRDIRRLLDD